MKSPHSRADTMTELMELFFGPVPGTASAAPSSALRADLPARKRAHSPGGERVPGSSSSAGPQSSPALRDPGTGVKGWHEDYVWPDADDTEDAEDEIRIVDIDPKLGMVLAANESPGPGWTAVGEIDNEDFDALAFSIPRDKVETARSALASISPVEEKSAGYADRYEVDSKGEATPPRELGRSEYLNAGATAGLITASIIAGTNGDHRTRDMLIQLAEACKAEDWDDMP